MTLAGNTDNSVSVTAESLAAATIAMTSSPTDGSTASYSVTLTDLAGNSQTFGSGATGTVTVDNTAPSGTITVSVTGNTNATITLGWSNSALTESGSGLGAFLVSWTGNDSQAVSDTTSANGAATYVTPYPLTGGSSYTFTVTPIDLVGHTGTPESTSSTTASLNTLTISAVSVSNSAGNAKFTLTSPGTHSTVYYWNTDEFMPSGTTGHSSSGTTFTTTYTYGATTPIICFCLYNTPTTTYSRTYVCTWGTSYTSTSKSLSTGSYTVTEMDQRTASSASPFAGGAMGARRGSSVVRVGNASLSFVDQVGAAQGSEAVYGTSESDADLVMRPVLVSYAPEAASRAASNIDASGLSILQRYEAMGKARTPAETKAEDAKATEVRFAGPSAPIAQAPSSSATPNVGGASSSGDASPMPAPRSAAPNAPLSGSRVAPSASEPQPAKDGPTAPAQGGPPGIDLYAEQGRSREKEGEESWDGTE